MSEETKADEKAKADEIERLINKPAEFTIGSKKVFVEAQPPGAVTCIIRHLIEKAKRIDLDILKKYTKDKIKDKDKVDEMQAESIYDLLSEKIAKDAQEDLVLFQMILTPAEIWAKRRGNLAKSDYPVTVKDLEWDTPEKMLLDMFLEWSARNPRFERQKKTLEMASK